ncbi:MULTISPECIES: hypothetical protein [Falsihalocynthiibacter]
MAKENRWMKAVIAESAKAQPAMPWERGNRRAAMIARRLRAAEAVKQVRA